MPGRAAALRSSRCAATPPPIGACFILGHHLHQRCGLFPDGGPILCRHQLLFSKHLPVLRGAAICSSSFSCFCGTGNCKPDHETVLMGSLPRYRCGPGSHGTLLQRDMEIDHAFVAGRLGAEHAVKPGILMRMYAHCQRMGEDTERIVAYLEITHSPSAARGTGWQRSLPVGEILVP